MSPEIHRAAFELFDTLRELTPEERARYFDEAEEVSDEVRAALRSLLASDSPTNEFAGLPVPDASMALLGGVESVFAPERVGRYRIERLIGAGGFGSVYLAEQDSPRRRVAIKLLRPGLSEAHARRLAFEAEALGRLSHPGIASVHEFGHDEARGVAFLAMEYVDGVSLDRHVRDKGLSVEATLRLLLVVCAAIEHAHQRGVLHRDLAPKNILVTPEGVPKVIDFGLASVREAALKDRLTLPGSIVGTIRYASPEQLDAGEGALDTRSDVYSLGTMAYELVTGAHPYLPEDASIGRAVELLASGSPRRPSSLIAPGRLGRDLDAVLLKAVQREPARRYQSVDALAADVSRLLAGFPVEAAGWSAVHCAGKFARRHSVGVAVAVGVIAMVGAAGGLWLNSLAREAEARESAINALDVVLRNVLSPMAPRIGTAAERDALLATIEPDVLTLVGRAGHDPRVAALAAPFYVARGDAHRELGRHSQAYEAYALAVPAYQRLWNEQGRTPSVGHEYSLAIVKLGDAEFHAGRDGVGRALYLEALDLDEQLVAENPAHIGLLSNLFWSYERHALLEINAGRMPDAWTGPMEGVAARMVQIDPGSWRTVQAEVHAAIRRAQRLTHQERPADALHAWLDAVDAADRGVNLNAGWVVSQEAMVFAAKGLGFAAEAVGDAELARMARTLMDRAAWIRNQNPVEPMAGASRLGPIQAERAMAAIQRGDAQEMLRWVERRVRSCEWRLAYTQVTYHPMLELGRMLELRARARMMQGHNAPALADADRLDRLAQDLAAAFPDDPEAQGESARNIRRADGIRARVLGPTR